MPSVLCCSARSFELVPPEVEEDSVFMLFRCSCSELSRVVKLSRLSFFRLCGYLRRRAECSDLVLPDRLTRGQCGRSQRSATHFPCPKLGARKCWPPSRTLQTCSSGKLGELHGILVTTSDRMLSCTALILEVMHRLCRRGRLLNFCLRLVLAGVEGPPG